MDRTEHASRDSEREVAMRPPQVKRMTISAHAAAARCQATRKDSLLVRRILAELLVFATTTTISLRALTGSRHMIFTKQAYVSFMPMLDFLYLPTRRATHVIHLFHAGHAMASHSRFTAPILSPLVRCWFLSLFYFSIFSFILRAHKAPIAT